MLTDITLDHEEISEAEMTCGDTSIAVDPDRVKSLPALESSASGGVSVVEPGDGLGAQVWLESGERLAGPVVGSTGRDAAPTLAGMVLPCPREGREEAPHAGSGKLLCAVVAALVLAWWPQEQQELALALDATTLGQRFTVLCVSVLVRGCAIPVACKVLASNQKGSWQP